MALQIRLKTVLEPPQNNENIFQLKGDSMRSTARTQTMIGVAIVNKWLTRSSNQTKPPVQLNLLPGNY